MRLVLVWPVLLHLASAGVPHQRNKEPQLPVQNVQVGDRPYYLINDMQSGELKSKLQSCSEGPFRTSPFVFGHRGAPLQYPEHTAESYRAAARQGAGTVECDVTFTKDRELVCRHSQCDLHTTTDILLRPELAAKCTQPFTPYNVTNLANAQCCTSDITLKEFKSLCGKMDGANPLAKSIKEYVKGTPYFQTDLYAMCGTVVSHAESIALINSYGLNFTPEIKLPSVDMPFEGSYTQQQYAEQILQEYRAANIAPARVFFQSILLDDIYYLVEHAPDFARQAIFLDKRVNTAVGTANATASMAELAAHGVRIVGPPIFALLKLDATNTSMVASEYARAIKQAGMDIISWSFDRSGWLSVGGGGYFYQSVAPLIKRDGDMYTVLDVLARTVGIKAIFSDWPATVTYYANCFGL